MSERSSHACCTAVTLEPCTRRSQAEPAEEPASSTRVYASRSLVRGLKVQDGRRNDHDRWHRRSRCLPTPGVEIDSFNLERKDDEGFLGDRASKGAFRETLEKWRKPLRKSGEDPFGKELSEDISKKDLDAILAGDDAEASAVVHSAVEDFAQDLVDRKSVV